MLFTANWHPRFVFNLKRVIVLFRFGWKLLASSLLENLYNNLSSLVIGKKYNADTLGYYSRGAQFPQFIINAISGAIQSVMLPALSADQDDIAKVKFTMRNSMTMSAYIIFPMMAGLAAVSTPLVTLLLTEKWLPSVPYMQIYCLAMAFIPIQTGCLQGINAVGRSDVFLKLAIIKTGCSLAVLIAAVYLFTSPIAIALVTVVTTLVGAVINAVYCRKLIGYGFREQLSDIMLPGLLTVLNSPLQTVL
jgi:O-antigen/teichoic acid export membrane protein